MSNYTVELVIKDGNKDIAKIPVTMGVDTISDRDAITRSAVRLFDSSIENPAVIFARNVKAGKYDSLTDEEYDSMINDVETKAIYWGRKPVASLMEVAFKVAIDICLDSISIVHKNANSGVETQINTETASPDSFDDEQYTDNPEVPVLDEEEMEIPDEEIEKAASVEDDNVYTSESFITAHVEENPYDEEVNNLFVPQPVDAYAAADGLSIKHVSANDDIFEDDFVTATSTQQRTQPAVHVEPKPIDSGVQATAPTNGFDITKIKLSEDEQHVVDLFGYENLDINKVKARLIAEAKMRKTKN